MHDNYIIFPVATTVTSDECVVACGFQQCLNKREPWFHHSGGLDIIPPNRYFF